MSYLRHRPGTPKAAVSGAGAAAVITLAASQAGSKRRWIVAAVYGSYSAAPTGGKVTITDSVVSFEFDIVAAGPFWIEPCIPMEFAAEQAVTITLAGGGGAIIAKVNAVVLGPEVM